jgi:hypothetical protein
MNKYLKKTYFVRNIDNQKIELPLYFHSLSKGKYFISQMNEKNQNIVVPSKYFNTDCHLLTDFYKSIF